MAKAKKRVADVVRVRKPLAVERVSKRRPRWADSVSEGFDEALGIGDFFDDAAAAARADGDLSSSGRDKAVLSIGQDALAKVEQFELTHVLPYRTNAASIEARLRARAEAANRPTDPAELLVHELRLQEIRRELRGLDPLERAAIYSATDDPMVRDAIESAPPTVARRTGQAGEVPKLEPFIPDDFKTRAAASRARAIDPDLADEMEALLEVAEMFQQQAGALRAAIIEDVGPLLAADAPVEVVGAGD